MAEAKALLHFPDLRGECVIVKYVRDPTGEIAPKGVSRENAGRNLSQERQEILEGSRRTGNRLNVIREPESLLHEQLHIEIFCLVPDMRRQTWEQFEFQASPPGFSHSRQ